MALSAAQTTKIFKIFGIPQKTSGFVAYPLLYGTSPSGVQYDFTELKSQLDAAIAAVSATQETEVSTLLTAWDDPNDYGELEVTADAGSEGVLVDYAKRRDLIRMALSNVLGFACPSGGFAKEAEQQNSCHRILR